MILREKRALLPLVFVLFLPLSAANTGWIIYSERSEPLAGDLLVEMTEEEIDLSYDGNYRDGLIDNFDYFKNPGYPSGCMQAAGNTGSG